MVKRTMRMKIISLTGRHKIHKDKIINKHLHPSGAVFWRKFQKLLVELATSVELSQLQFKLNVSTKQFVFRALANCRALENHNMKPTIHTKRQITEFKNKFCQRY